MKFWPVIPPLDQYNENVEALAKQHGLKIYDPTIRTIHPHHHGINLPILTLKTVENNEKVLNTCSPKRSKRKNNNGTKNDCTT